MIDHVEGDDEQQGRLMALQSSLKYLTNNARGNYNQALYELLIEEQKKEAARKPTNLENFIEDIKGAIRWLKQLRN